MTNLNFFFVLGNRKKRKTFFWRNFMIQFLLPKTHTYYVYFYNFFFVLFFCYFGILAINCCIANSFLILILFLFRTHYFWMNWKMVHQTILSAQRWNKNEFARREFLKIWNFFLSFHIVIFKFCHKLDQFRSRFLSLFFKRTKKRRQQKIKKN